MHDIVMENDRVFGIENTFIVICNYRDTYTCLFRLAESVIKLGKKVANLVNTTRNRYIPSTRHDGTSREVADC